MKNDVVYVYVNESNQDCSADVQVFDNKEKAKAKINAMFEEYVNGNEYLATVDAKNQARKEYKESKGEFFTILLGNGYGEDDELMSFRIEERLVE